MRLTAAGIVVHPDPVLAVACAEADPRSPETAELVRRLLEALAAAGGIGLAAPQVGIPSRVCLVGVPEDGRMVPLVMVNPRIVRSGGVRTALAEGCLSIPGKRFMVERPSRVEAEFTGIDGSAGRISASGLVAKCIQHELDHLDGVMICDLGPEATAAA